MACLRRGASTFYPIANRALFTAGQPAPGVGAAAFPAMDGSLRLQEEGDKFQREAARAAFRRLGLQLPLGFSWDDPACRAEVLHALQVEDQAASMFLAAARRACASKSRSQGSDKN